MLHPLLSLTLVAAQLLLAVTPLYCCHGSDGDWAILVGSGCHHASHPSAPHSRCCQAACNDQSPSAYPQGPQDPKGEVAKRRCCIDLPIAQGQLARPENVSAKAPNCASAGSPVMCVDIRSPAQSCAAPRQRDDGLLADCWMVVLRC